MTIPIPAGDVTSLQKSRHRGKPNLSIFRPPTILAAQLAGAHTRGARSVAYDNGTGTFSLIRSYQALWVGTAPGRSDIGIVRIKSISGTAASGTIELDENGIVFADNHFLTIKHHYPPINISPRIFEGTFYKFFNLTYAAAGDPGKEPPPVCICGEAARVGRLSGGSLVFSFDLSDSYPVAQGATKVSYGLTVAPATGATVSFNTGTGIGTITVTTPGGQWWATASVTDSNGKTQERFIALIEDSTPYTKYNPVSYEEGWGRGVRAGFELSGDVTLDDVPDEALIVEWYDGYFDDVEDYVNILNTGDNVLSVAYVAGDTATDDFAGQGAPSVRFEVETVDNILDNIFLDPVTLEAVTSPTTWFEYARWLTIGRAIHHLLKWHTPIMELCDVIGLLDNTEFVKATEFESGSIRAMANNEAEQRGIFAQLTSDRLGRLHLATDSQKLNQAQRDALPTILEISEADVSGPIMTVRRPAGRAAKAQLSGAHFDGSKSSFYVSMIPGYIESSVSYGLPAIRGTQALNRPNQVLASQTDANEKVGRIFTEANMPISEFRITFRGNYTGALTTIPTHGWYELGIANTSLARQLPLNGIRLICRSVRLSIESGDFVTDAVFTPEAIGPDGIPGNYPQGLPAPLARSTPPRWDAPGSLPALATFSSLYYRDDDAGDWTQLDTGDYNHGAIDPWWRVKRQTLDPRSAIMVGVGEAGLIARLKGTAGRLEDLTPVDDPPNTWSGSPAPTVGDLSLIQILGDPWIEDRWYILAAAQDGSDWRGWLLVSDDDLDSFSYVELYDGLDLPDQVRPLWMAVNGSYLLITIWEDDTADTLRLLVFDKTPEYDTEYDLGAATSAEVEDRDHYAFPVTVIDDDDLWHVAGRMAGPQSLSNPEQAISTVDAGANWAGVEDSWAADHCAALAVSVEDGGGDRDYWAVRKELTSAFESSTWTAETTPSASGYRHCTDGVDIYSVNVSTDNVERYNVATDTEDTILNESGTNLDDICYFNGGILLYSQGASNGDVIIRRWDIGAETWTTVYSNTGVGPTGSSASIFAVSPTVAVCSVDIGIGDLMVYSADGVTWNVGSFDDAGSAGGRRPHEASANLHYTLESSFDLYQEFDSNAGSGENRLYIWNTNEWLAVATGYSWSYLFADNLFHWRNNAGTFEYSSDAGTPTTWNAPTDTNVTPVRSVNMPVSVGYRRIGSDLFIYYWDTSVGEWSAGELLNTGVVSSASINEAFRLDDGQLWVKRNRDGVQAWFFRDAVFPDDPFSAGAGACKFYSGQNGTLTERSDMDVCVVNPDALAVRKDGRAAVGGAEAGGGGEIIVTGVDSDDYAAWTDLTDSLAGVPVNAIKWINGDVD